MARRNLKKNTVNGFMLPPPVVTVVLVVSVVALAYIWLGCQCEEVGKAINELESERLTLREQLGIEEHKWSQMIRVENLEAELRRHGLCMHAPAVGQVVQLSGRFYDAWRTTAPGAGAVARLHSGYVNE